MVVFMWGKLKTQFHNIIAFYCLFDRSHFQVARHFKKTQNMARCVWGDIIPILNTRD